MKILYVGQLWSGGTCRARLHALERLGVTIIAFDVTPFLSKGTRLEKSVQSRMGIGRGIAALNKALGNRAKETDFDIIWIDKGVWLYPETLKALRLAASRQFAIHYTPDPQLLYNRSRNFEKCIKIYDLIVTTKSFEVDNYRSLGARNIELVLQGYGRQFISKSEGGDIDPQLQSEICFIGHCERHYADLIKVASESTTGLRVWGPRWPRFARWHRWARPIVHGEGLWEDSYPRALRSSKIALGLLSKAIPETTTTRTFEIPATGTFMLAERNGDHLALFEEGKEAEFFSSDDELREKIKFYLTHDNARNRIAIAGRERSLRSGYSDEHQLRRVLDAILTLV